MKAKIAGSFSDKAESYESYARVQKKAASLLLSYFEDFLLKLKPGPVLEIACGTGFVSSGLLNLLSEREFIFSDIASSMLDFCRRRLLSSHPEALMKFSLMDGEKLYEKERYALIVSAFGLQWFSDLEGSIKRFFDALLPGGLLALSFQADGSFPEWREICMEEGIAFSANPLPDGEKLADFISSLASELKFYSGFIKESYPEPRYFFKTLLATGASTSLSKEKRDPYTLAKLIAAWKKKQGVKPVSISYKSSFIFAFKPEAGSENKKGSFKCINFPDIFL